MLEVKLGNDPLGTVAKFQSNNSLKIIEFTPDISKRKISGG